MRRLFRASILAVVLVWPSAAELNSNDRAFIKEMTRGELYLRNNLPCRYTSGFGIGAEVVTEVSPAGVEWDKNLQSIQEQQLKKGKKKRWSGPRQETGASGDNRRVLSASTGFPAELRFIDGKLAVIEQKAQPVRVNIDK